MGEELTKRFSENMSSFFQEIPDILPTFQGEYKTKPLKVLYFESPTAAPREVKIPLYPFQTIQELKMKIALSFSKEGKGDDPAYLSLLIPLPDEDETEENQTRSYIPADFLWMVPSKKGKAMEVPLQNPFERMVGKGDGNFVGLDGRRKPISISDHSRLLLEDIQQDRLDRKVTVLHAFFYSDLEPKIQAVRPFSEATWYSKLYPYFPRLSIEAQGALTKEQIDETELYTQYVLLADLLLESYDALLGTYREQHTKKEYDPYRLRLGGIKYLRLLWKAVQDEDKQNVDILFYKLPVKTERPFLRILPADGTPVSKILVKKDPMPKTPAISDPKLLFQWAQEKSPTPERDFLMVKTILKPPREGTLTYYGTMRIFSDNVADYILMPPKHIRFFDLKVHLQNFPELLEQAIIDTPFRSYLPEIDRASVLCGIRLPSDTPPLRRDDLRNRVLAMSYFFQEIVPLPGPKPFLTLRFKAVSNYVNQDRINSFLKQLTDRFIEEGIPLSEQTEYVMREFNLPYRQAYAYVSKFHDRSTEFTVIDPDAKEFISTYNYGVDIVIFAQHPTYSFHIYGINSQETLRRVMTALYLLFSTKSDDWTTARRYVQRFNKTAEEVHASPPTPPPATTVAELPTQAEMDEAPETFDESMMNLMFGAFGDEAQAGNTLRHNANVNPAAENLGSRLAGPPPREELAGILAAPPRAQLLASAAPTQTVAPAKPVNNTGHIPENFENYFLDRLQEADSRLFNYKKADESEKQYASMCQANDMRQPIVMSQDQYDVMIEKYGEKRFVRVGYDPESGEPFEDEVPEEGESISVIFYGSEPSRSFYYLCPKYFCYKDYIVVFESDLVSTIDYYGKEKPPNTCPFCHGKVIPPERRKKPGEGETVFQRKVKPKSDNKAHVVVGWLLKKGAHPEGFRLPCCFLEDQKISPADPVFQPYRDQMRLTKPVESTSAVVPTAPQGPAAEAASQDSIDYATAMNKAYQKNILGPEKFPLEVADKGPQVGQVPSILDTFFDQNPADMLSRDFNRMLLKPVSRGFVRLAVENRTATKPDSFLSAIAPFISRDTQNSIEDVKDRLLIEITPKIFMFLNYGNLLLEFYDPNVAITEDLGLWASKHLDLSYEDAAEYIERIYKSYTNFSNFIKSPNRRKEYRQFAHFLSSKLPMTMNRGILFMILDHAEDGKLTVRCPPFGYDPEKHTTCDIGLLYHHYSGYYEPLFYVENSIKTREKPEIHKTVLKFQAADEIYWTDILRKRVHEFRTQCVASNKGYFTSLSMIDNTALLSLTEAIQKLKSPPPLVPGSRLFNGIVKDAYNHTVGITFQIVPRGKPIVIPVVDDGTLNFIDRHVYLDWDLVKDTAAPADEIYTFYEKYVVPTFPQREGYKIVHRVESRGERQLVALQLANGIYIPARPPLKPKVIEHLNVVAVSEMEYSINKEIYFGNKTKAEAKRPEELLKAEQNNLEEVYQHLRFTFGRWISQNTTTQEVKEKIIELVKRRDLPLFEKRKRLFIMIGSTVGSWLDTSPKPADAPENDDGVSSLLRKDCIFETKKDKNLCTGRCVWRSKAEPGSGEPVGACYLHAPATIRLGKMKAEDGTYKERILNVIPLFVHRLLEELLRFPEKREQLLENQVSSMIALKDAVLLGKNQYIIPEDTTAWYDLLRMDWMPSIHETPKFMEEMSRTLAPLIPKTARPKSERAEGKGEE